MRQFNSHGLLFIDIVPMDAIPALEFKRETRRTSVTTLMKEGVID